MRLTIQTYEGGLAKAKAEAESLRAENASLLAAIGALQDTRDKCWAEIAKLREEVEQLNVAAAMAVEAERKTITSLREALRPFAEDYAKMDHDISDDFSMRHSIRVGDYRRAAKVWGKT